MSVISEREILRRLWVIARIEPTPAATNRALERVWQTLEREKRRLQILHAAAKLAKFAVAAVVGIVAATALYYFIQTFVAPPAAFADVLEQISRASTVAYKETFHYADGHTVTTEKTIIDSGISRRTLPNGDVLIYDFNVGKSLHLMPKSYKAVLTYHVGRKHPKKLFNYLDWAINLHQQSGRFIGDEQIGGLDTSVFVIEAPFEQTTIWTDPATNLPVKVKIDRLPHSDKSITPPYMELAIRDFGGETNEVASISITGAAIQEKLTIVMTDFVWNAEMDESLFALEPPAGYSLEEKHFNVSEAGEVSLIYALSFWAQMSDGRFPQEINDLGDPNKLKPLLLEKFDRDGDPQEELDLAIDTANEILKGLMFAQQQKVEGDWNYAADGVRLGEADKPLCWWKNRLTQNWRVIYGDLSIADTTDVPIPYTQTDK
jgi:hypothetical protein